MSNNAMDRKISTALHLDAEQESIRIGHALRSQVRGLRKRGLVIGLSGGIDSSACAALAVNAVGAGNVLAIYMPEADSDPQSLDLAQQVAAAFGIEGVLEDIAPSLAAMGCYQRRDQAIRVVVPGYGEGWRSKIVIANSLEHDGYNLSSLVVESPDGEQQKVRLPIDVYLAIVAATNMKQRTRKQVEYYHADRCNFAVIGTPNRLEYDQGFFVKNGDGAADVKPIAHLYKTQVYQLARHLGVPEAICQRPPTTDTYSLPQTQEEFYFALPYALMDVCLYGLNNKVSATEVGAEAGLSELQVTRVWRDIESKRRAAEYLHSVPQLVSPSVEVEQPVLVQAAL